MSILSQNVNVIRTLKKNIDAEGNKWVQRFPSCKSRNPLHDILVRGEKTHCRILSKVPVWKTTLVETNDTSFCLCLDLYKSFKYSIETPYDRETILALYNRVKSYTSYYDNLFGVSNYLGLQQFFDNLTEVQKALEKEISNITYMFDYQDDDVFTAVRFIDKNFNTKSIKYLPLIIINLASAKGTKFDISFLMDDMYKSHYEGLTMEELTKIILRTSFVSDIFANSPTMGLNHLKFRFCKGYYSFTTSF